MSNKIKNKSEEKENFTSDKKVCGDTCLNKKNLHCKCIKDSTTCCKCKKGSTDYGKSCCCSGSVIHFFKKSLK